MRRLLAFAAALAALVVFGPALPAQAHTTLKSASPGKGEKVDAPGEIVLIYTEAVRLPRVVLTDSTGRRRAIGSPAASNAKVTSPINERLAAGEYTVAWRVVAADGHPVAGTYEFTVKAGAAAQPSGQAAASPARPAGNAGTPAAAPSEDSGGGSGWVWVGLIAAVVAAAAGAAVQVRRRKG